MTDPIQTIAEEVAEAVEDSLEEATEEIKEVVEEAGGLSDEDIDKIATKVYDKVAGQITAQQIDTMGRLIAKQSLLTGIHIGRDTIIPHAYINTVDRPHCPAINIDAVMNQIVAAANSYLLPKTFAITWTATPPAQRTTTVVWTPLGFQITKS